MVAVANLEPAEAGPARRAIGDGGEHQPESAPIHREVHRAWLAGAVRGLHFVLAARGHVDAVLNQIRDAREQLLLGDQPTVGRADVASPVTINRDGNSLPAAKPGDGDLPGFDLRLSSNNTGQRAEAQRHG